MLYIVLKDVFFTLADNSYITLACELFITYVVYLFDNLDFDNELIFNFYL